MSTTVRICAVLLVGAMLAGCTTMMGETVITGSGRADHAGIRLQRLHPGEREQRFQGGDRPRGESYKVSVTVDDNLVEYLDVRVDGDTLRIGMKPRVSFGFRNVTQRAEITMPEIEGIQLSGATQGDVSGFTGEKMLVIDVSGASRLRGGITAGDTRMQVSGASTVEIEGGAADLDVEASGASSVRLDDFTAQDAWVEASGASNITVNATGRVTGSASGALTVHYIGNPESVRVDSSGASNVRQK